MFEKVDFSRRFSILLRGAGYLVAAWIAMSLVAFMAQFVVGPVWGGWLFIGGLLLCGHFALRDLRRRWR